MKMQGDLSLHHQPLNESFSARVTPELWEKYRLSDEQVAFFNEIGYLSNVRILSDEQVAQLNRELDEIKVQQQVDEIRSEAERSTADRADKDAFIEKLEQAWRTKDSESFLAR